MYDSNPYLTKSLVEEVFAEYEWPAPYTVHTREVDAVLVEFPKCGFILHEGASGRVILKFRPQDTGVDQALELVDALAVLSPPEERKGGSHTPGLIKRNFIGVSEGKTKNQLQNLCIVAQYHLKPTIQGDFSWVQKVMERRAARQK